MGALEYVFPYLMINTCLDYMLPIKTADDSGVPMWLLLFLRNLLFMCVSTLPECMSVYHVSTMCLLRLEDGEIPWSQSYRQL